MIKEAVEHALAVVNAYPEIAKLFIQEYEEAISHGVGQN